MSNKLRDTFDRHTQAFRATYGLKTPVATLVDCVTLVVGVLLYQLEIGTLWTVLGLAMAAFSAGGLLKRVYDRVVA